MRRVVVYPSGLVHWANPRKTELAKWMDMSEIIEEDWKFWRTICGRDVIGSINDKFYPETTCQRCIRGFDRAARLYREMEERFGGKSF